MRVVVMIDGKSTEYSISMFLEDTLLGNLQIKLYKDTENKTKSRLLPIVKIKNVDKKGNVCEFFAINLFTNDVDFEEIIKVLEVPSEEIKKILSSK